MAWQRPDERAHRATLMASSGAGTEGGAVLGVLLEAGFMI